MLHTKKIKYIDLKNRKISFNSFLCKDGCIVYKIVRKDEAKLFLEYVEEENYYVVTCNKSISDKEILEYIKNNYEWVLNWYKNIDNPSPWYIFGKPVPVKIIIDNKFLIDYKDNLITVHLKHKRDYKNAIKHFYKQIGLEYLKPRTELLINQLNVRGTFREVKWLTWAFGNCNYKKEICLAARLMQFSKEFIDSVIYHEIAHFTYMNHKKQFWELLSIYCPNYKQLDKECISFSIKHHLW